MADVPAYYKIRKIIQAHNKQKKMQKMGRVAWCANYLRDLDRPRTREDIQAMAEELGVSERSVYGYIKNDFPKLQVCETCGRPFGEEKMIATLEEIGAI